MASSFELPIYKPSTNLDLLELPILGRVLRWRWGRLVFQVVLLAVAGLAIYDGFTGPQLAPANSATVLAWVHYRGLVVLGLLLLGNLFCSACPFTLPRTLARRVSLAGRRWPAWLRNKWVSFAGLFLVFWVYEWFDLWASPWLTAWLIVTYFVGSFALEALFHESPFCKYVCPLGAFNFTLSTVSPLQIEAKDAGVCRTCVGKECINGSPEVPGCGTELFVPTITSNMDCTFCLDCARACPYDNVALKPRSPLRELLHGGLPHRWDMAFLIVSLTFMGLLNAFGMVNPVYRVQAWIQSTFGFASEAWTLLIVFGAGNLVLPAVVVFGCAALSSRLAEVEVRTRARGFATRFAPAFVPLAAGIWTAHYGFHLATGGLTVIPVLQSFLLDHGLSWLGSSPNWELSYLLPSDIIFPLQVLAVLGGFSVTLYVLGKSALGDGQNPIGSLLVAMPWAIVLVGLALAALSVFNLPMEMRGTIFLGQG